MVKQCTQCGSEGVEYYASDRMCKECRKEFIRNYRLKKKIKEEEEKLKKRSLDDLLEDMFEKIDSIYIGQKDMQIKQRDLEIKLENIRKAIT